MASQGQLLLCALGYEFQQCFHSILHMVVYTHMVVSIICTESVKREIYIGENLFGKIVKLIQNC